MARVISKAMIYGSSILTPEKEFAYPDFKTKCEHHAAAFDWVMDLEPEFREYLENSGRFTSATRLEGALRQMQFDAIWIETNRRRQTPVDQFGIDLPDRQPVHGGPPAHALRNEDKTAAA